MKKLLTFIICAALTVTAGAVTLDTAESAAEKNADTSCAELSSVNLGKPGYNLWTGTETPYTFENSPVVGNNNEAEINVDWSTVVLDTTDSGNSALKLSGDNPRFTVTTAFPEFASDERTFTLKFDSKTTTTSDMSFRVRPNRPGKWQYVNDVAKDCRAGILYLNLKNYNSGEWVSHTYTLDASDFTDHDAPLTDYSKINSFWLGLAGGFGETAAWIDNVSIIPNYKITYDLGEGSGTLENEFFYGDTYTLKVDTSLITPPEGKVFSHWEHQYGSKITKTVYPILGEDLVLTAVYIDESEAEEIIKVGDPGINLWTGTTEPFNFEGSLTVGSNSENKINIDWSGVALDSTTEAGNTSIKMTGDNPRFSVTDVFPTFESTERTFTLIFDAKTNYTGNMYFKIRPNRPGKWQYVNDVAKRCLEGIVTINITNTSTGDWVHHEVLVDPAGFTDNDAPLTDFTKITSFWLGLDGAYGENALWIDNVKIVPNYKITYDLGEAEGSLEDEFFLAEGYYMFKADASTITPPAGKVFSHWVDADGNIVNDTVTVNLGKDIKLTAVWVDDAPESYDKYEIRVGDNSGIRFFSSVSASQKSRAQEYGYIVARYFVIAGELGKNPEDLTFELTSGMYPEPLGSLYVKGVAYENNDGGDAEKDIEYGTDEDGNSIFTAVCTGIDLDDASQLTEQLVVRPYITVNGVTCYGTPRVKSFYEVASEISTSEAYDTLPQAQKDMIAHILEVCGN